MEHPPKSHDKILFNRIQGSLIGLALGDALGARVEFRPREYLLKHPVTDLQAGGTWGLKKGQFTDDTSMALCLASSLIVCRNFQPYDQLVRYKWWYRCGYMSSTGQCFDIGTATGKSLREFERRQNSFVKEKNISPDDMDLFSDQDILRQFDVNCSNDQSAGNGGLMRLAPVPLFFYKDPSRAVEYSGISARITHGDVRVYDACRFYGALIVAALNGEKKDDLLSPNFYQNHKTWFSDKPFHTDIQKIVEGSYKKKKAGYEDGIRGKGFIVNSLEAALWAFCFDDDSFRNGILAAVNLGDDADTTAAIYGQLAGAYYGYNDLPRQWVKHVYAKDFITCLSEWILYEGQIWFQKNQSTLTNSDSSSGNQSNTINLKNLSSEEVHD
ncbi:unnamed protein product [Rotaria sp. Silwood1]|nr:unnamed protein product [Rotaria sp. Silwood1]CAF3482393.1 unnamed protein product [Rotaria sp. Silwood1]CAF3491378.1 unnamed protein product [Rotaria sp. Silwood1]CAF4598261.1 unnamed protein product [Rotaria sp. Silwood1]CAF4884025.1 unnamed protein product [Rotaria sp. Silwood1]